MNHSNLIDVSKQQRIVFVDNIWNERAEELSSQYPFGVFMGKGPNPANSQDTSNIQNDAGLIYKNGKRYSLITGVDKSVIRVGVHNIGLQITANGTLGLNIGEAISSFGLYKYTTNGETYNPTDPIIIYNEADLYFKMLDGQNNQIDYSNNNILAFTSDLLHNGNIIISYESYSQEESNIIGDNESFVGIKYHINVLADSSTEEELTELTVFVSGLQELQALTYNIVAHKTSAGIFYIGSRNYFGNDDIFEIYDNQLDSNLDHQGWHTLENNNDYYEAHPAQFDYYVDIANGDCLCIVLPENVLPKLALHNSSNGERIVDYYNDPNKGSFNKETNAIIVNGNRYFIYTFKDQTITRFINYIG